MTNHQFTESESAAVYRVIAERRDMRHFLPTPVNPETLTKILQAAHQAPSVGLMQPWRFIRVTDSTIRNSIHRLVDEECKLTVQAIGEYENTARMAEFLRLKVEGILDCGELFVATLCNSREQHIFGLRMLPEMDTALVSYAIQNMWLIARAEGIRHELGISFRPCETWGPAERAGRSKTNCNIVHRAREYFLQRAYAG